MRKKKLVTPYIVTTILVIIWIYFIFAKPQPLDDNDFSDAPQRDHRGQP